MAEGVAVERGSAKERLLYRLRPNVWRAAVAVLLYLMGLAFLVPFLWMISSSLKPTYQIFAIPPQWIPRPARWQNYVEALTYVPFGRYTLNTLLIAASSIVGHLLSCTVIAYGFARLRAPGRDALFVVMLATMMLPYPVTMVPLYVLFHRLGWINTILPLTAPSFFGNPFYIFLLRQFFRSVPMELEEAAIIDGASRFRIWWQLFLPLSKPALATVAVFTFQNVLNDFYGPLIFLTSQEKYTLALGINMFKGLYATEISLMMAMALLMVIPMIIMFFVAQKQMIRGVILTGIKA